jgi:hypothetical protein
MSEHYHLVYFDHGAAAIRTAKNWRHWKEENRQDQSLEEDQGRHTRRRGRLVLEGNCIGRESVGIL